MQVITSNHSQLVAKKVILSSLLSYEEVDHKITGMIESAALIKKTNGFFQLARKVRLTSLKPAIEIAYNWREFTKQFVFTVLAGIGVLAEEVGRQKFPSENLLHVLQTGFTIISDDLMNASPLLCESAPKGPAGVHYRWWEDTILNPLLTLADKKGEKIELTLTSQAKELLHAMEKLAKTSVGAAVQLRIVEAIAYDIVVAFRIMYANLEIDGHPVFPNRKDLAWMNAHVKAEVIHHRQATNEDCGLVRIANTVQEQEILFEAVEDYISRWVAFLDSFKNALQN